MAVPVAVLDELAAPLSPPVALEVAEEAPVFPDTAFPVACAEAAPESPAVAEPVTSPVSPDTSVTAMPPEPPPPLLSPVSPVLPLTEPVSPLRPYTVALPPSPVVAVASGLLSASPDDPEDDVAVLVVVVSPLTAELAE